jgi:hypothetical protein
VWTDLELENQVSHEETGKQVNNIALGHTWFQEEQGISTKARSLTRATTYLFWKFLTAWEDSRRQRLNHSREKEKKTEKENMASFAVWHGLLFWAGYFPTTLKFSTLDLLSCVGKLCLRW